MYYIYIYINIYSMDWFKGNPQDTIYFPMGVGDGRMVLWMGGWGDGKIWIWRDTEDRFR